MGAGGSGPGAHLAAGLPVEGAPFVVRGDEARLEADDSTGVENGGFVGDCEIARNSGGDDVGDLSSSDGLSVIVAVDNVESQPTEELNFVMLNDENFRVVNVPGTVESITESGSRTSSGSRDYVTIVFAGTLEDGRAVEAELLCELQNKF